MVMLFVFRTKTMKDGNRLIDRGRIDTYRLKAAFEG